MSIMDMEQGDDIPVAGLLAEAEEHMAAFDEEIDAAGRVECSCWLG